MKRTKRLRLARELGASQSTCLSCAQTPSEEGVWLPTRAAAGTCAGSQRAEREALFFFCKGRGAGEAALLRRSIGILGAPVADASGTTQFHEIADAAGTKEVLGLVVHPRYRCNKSYCSLFFFLACLIPPPRRRPQERFVSLTLTGTGQFMYAGRHDLSSLSLCHSLARAVSPTTGAGGVAAAWGSARRRQRSIALELASLRH